MNFENRRHLALISLVWYARPSIRKETSTTYTKVVHVTYRYVKVATPAALNYHHTYVESLSNIRNVNGRPSQLTARDPGYVDYYGRPWAEDWEKWFEKDW